MLFFGLVIFILVIFIQPQEFLHGLMGMRLVAIIMATVGVGWLFRLLGYRKYVLFEPPQNKFMFFLWIVVVISGLNVSLLAYPFALFVEWGKVFLIFILIINIIDSENKLRKIFFTIALGALIISIMGIFQYYGKDITGIGTQQHGRIRGIGIFDTNQLGYTLSFCIPMVFCLMIIYRNALVRLFFIIVLGSYGYCIFLTQSRGGAICLIFTLFLVFIIFSKNYFMKFIGIVLSVLVLFLFVTHSSRLSTVTQYQTDTSSMDRLYIWGEGLISAKRHLLFGIGKGRFFPNFGMAAHSSYIEVLSELGLFGLYFWMALFYFSIRNIGYILRFSVEKSKKQLRIFAKGLLVSICAYLMGSLFSTNSYYITLFIIFALVVVLQNLTEKKVLKQCNHFSFGDILVIGFIEGLVIIGLHLWVRMAS